VSLPWWPENSGIVSAEAMARTYRRDARGRFAGGGFSGQSGGRGARLKGGGKTRDGGGAKMKGARTDGTVAKPRGLKPGSIKPKAASRKPIRKKQKTADQLLTQATRIQITSNRLSRKARTGVQSRRFEERGARAASAARTRAFDLQKPKPLSKTAQLQQQRAERRKAREMQWSAARGMLRRR
jgi:hypothetical protein